MQRDSPAIVHSPALEASERAVRLLTDRYADGTVSEAEFERRLALLRAARGADELTALVADLGEPASALAEQRWLVPAERRIAAIATEIKRKGWWEVPQLLRVRAVMSNVELDFREAPLAAGCTIEVHATLANLLIIVPPGLAVDFDVSATLGTALNKAVPRGRFRPGSLLLRVHGSVLLGEVKVVVRELGPPKKRGWLADLWGSGGGDDE